MRKTVKLPLNIIFSVFNVDFPLLDFEQEDNIFFPFLVIDLNVDVFFNTRFSLVFFAMKNN